MARSKYAADFEVIGGEIEAFMKTMTEQEKRAALGNAGGWETMVNYVRGQNMDKIVNARIEKALEQRLGTARNDQHASAPPNIAASGVTTPAPAISGVVFDATTIEVMKTVLNSEDTPLARAEWVKWSNKSSGAG
jgi:hypothetical protein